MSIMHKITRHIQLVVFFPVYHIKSKYLNQVVSIGNTILTIHIMRSYLVIASVYL